MITETLKPQGRWWRRVVSASLLAMVAPLAIAEDGGDTQPGGEVVEPPVEVDPTQERAEALLAEWSDAMDVVNEGRSAAAQYHYTQGQRALEAMRLPEALDHLRKAVDYDPANETYRTALSRAATIAGEANDTFNTYTDEIHDQLTVEQQRLWIDVQAKIEEGMGHLEQGAYNQADLAFEMARVRLERLPYADERREAEMRRVEILIAETRQRKARQELEDQRLANQTAQTRERELRRYQLKLEQDRINAMLGRALKARERRDYDKCILLCEQVLRINNADMRAHGLISTARHERHAYLRQITADAWDEEHKLLSERIRRDMLPQLDLVSYSEDWPEIDAMRQPPTRSIGGSEDEAWRQDIERNLDQKISVNFDDRGISEVVAFLQRNTNVNFVLDPEVAAMEPIVQLQLEDVSLRNALGYIMLHTDLSYALQNQAVYISTDDGLRGDAYVRVYDIRDLTIGLTNFPGPEMSIPDPNGDGARLLPETSSNDGPEATDFLDIILEVVSPDSWDRDETNIDELNGSLVVTQSTDVHEQIEELLRTLRNQQAVQINVKVRFLDVDDAMLEEIGVTWNNFNGPPGYPNPIGAGPNPQTPTVQPPWWFGGYARTNDASHIGAGQVTNDLLDYFSQSGLRPTGGLTADFQLFEDPEGFLGRAVLRAVEKTNRSNIAIQPDLTLMSGQQAHLVRMNQQSYIADYDVVGGQYDPIIQVISYGTVLDVRAIASADRKYITMTLKPTNTRITAWRRFGSNQSDFGGEDVINTDADGNDLGAIAGLFPLFVPEMAYTSVETTVTIPDGGSLLIAGMTTANSSRAHSGVPFLSHIPFLGRLFSANGRTERESKTLIYVEGNIILFDEIEAQL